MSIFETVKKAKLETIGTFQVKENEQLIKNICDFLQVDRSEFPGTTRRYDHVLMKVIYFAVICEKRKINGQYVSGFEIDTKLANRVMDNLGVSRAMQYHYIGLLTQDDTIRRQVWTFMRKYGYTSVLL
jgi:hypothetical protein